MITENLSTLKIHKLTQEQYDRELAKGTLDDNALYLTPDEEIDLSGYATKTELETANKRYLHKVNIACSDYLNTPYSIVSMIFISRNGTPLTTLAEIYTVKNTQPVLSTDISYYELDMPEGEYPTIDWHIDSDGSRVFIDYITAYTVPLTTTYHSFDASVCTITDTVTEV